MAKDRPPNTVSQAVLSLLLVEGDTEEIFYKRIKEHYLKNCRVTVENIEGLRNINVKIIDKVIHRCNTHPEEKLHVYCCLDRESRYGEVPGFSIEKVRKSLRDRKMQNVLSVNKIIATQQIESWFFHDIEGIYDFLKVGKTDRNSKAYRPVEGFTHKDLAKLFERHGKTYGKGKRSQHFINSLNLDRIISNCQYLQKGISLIRSRYCFLSVARNKR